MSRLRAFSSDVLVAGLISTAAFAQTWDMPTSYPEAKALWEASRLIIEERLEAQGLQVLFSVPAPPQGLYVRELIQRLDHLKGIRVHTH